jgi:hypothetical protein
MTESAAVDYSRNWLRAVIGGVISAADAALLAVLGASLGHGYALSFLLLVGYLPIILVPSVWDVVESPIAFALTAGSILWFLIGFVITYRAKTTAQSIWSWLLVYLLIGAVGLLILELNLLFP